jgi:hypothetical protein
MFKRKSIILGKMQLISPNLLAIKAQEPDPASPPEEEQVTYCDKSV